MADARWTEVDTYLQAALVPADPVLEQAVAGSRSAGLPPIAVSALQGKFLSVLTLLLRPRRILEIGTLGGYSTIWMARSLPPEGRLGSLELQPAHAAVATDNLRRAGLAERVDIRVGPAADSLRRMADAAEEPFDLVFIDADKAGTEEYLERCLALCRPGAAIVVDNVVRGGALVDQTADGDAEGMRRAVAWLGRQPRVEATVLQTVGDKGYDGFALAMVR